MKKLSFPDKICLNVDRILQTLTGTYPNATRPNPAAAIEENKSINDEEKKLAGGLMRINHAGEVCAQALYHGQSLTARLPNVREQMQEAAFEEEDHLAWCKQRLNELDAHASFLNPLWYVGSFTIGAVAGMVGDKWSLGFVAETEKQVVKHLEDHMQKISKKDEKSQAILKQMRDDEAKHQQMAMDAGALNFPSPVKKIMSLMSKAMTKTTFLV